MPLWRHIGLLEPNNLSHAVLFLFMFNIRALRFGILKTMIIIILCFCSLWRDQVIELCFVHWWCLSLFCRTGKPLPNHPPQNHNQTAEESEQRRRGRQKLQSANYKVTNIESSSMCDHGANHRRKENEKKKSSTCSFITFVKKNIN